MRRGEYVVGSRTIDIIHSAPTIVTMQTVITTRNAIGARRRPDRRRGRPDPDRPPSARGAAPDRRWVARHPPDVARPRAQFTAASRDAATCLQALGLAVHHSGITSDWQRSYVSVWHSQ